MMIRACHRAGLFRLSGIERRAPICSTVMSPSLPLMTPEMNRVSRPLAVLKTMHLYVGRGSSFVWPNLASENECGQDLPSQMNDAPDIGWNQIDRRNGRAAQNLFHPKQVAGVVSPAGAESQ